jgi:4-hydroxybenzoyl-CoA thioesterase
MLTTQREILIEWGDCDPAGIVYFPRYFAYFDSCTAGHFANAGIPKPELIRKYNIIGFPVVDVRANFRLPSSFGDRVIIETRIARWGNSSFDVEHRLLRSGELAIEGFEKRVWVARRSSDAHDIAATAIPAEVKALFDC